MNNRKAVFFDIDGTLVDQAYVMPESTAEAIRKLKENGHLSFICSGRSRGHIQSQTLTEAGFDGIISGCGTMIEYDHKTLYYYELDKSLVEHTIRTVRRYGFKPILEGREYLYMDEAEFSLGDPYAKKLRRELGPHMRTISGDWGNWEVSKLSCDMEGCDQESCFAALSEHYEYLVHNHAVVEMVPRGHDKKTGIEWICRHLGIDLKDTVAFGDGMNDVGMLSVAGTAVVMGNGREPVKKMADYVTGDIWEDGIWNACIHLGLI